MKFVNCLHFQINAILKASQNSHSKTLLNVEMESLLNEIKTTDSSFQVPRNHVQLKTYFGLGRGCDSDGRAVACDTRGLRFELTDIGKFLCRTFAYCTH